MGMKLDMIAAGAYSVALERGMAEKDADAMVSGIMEKAALAPTYSGDNDYDEDDTWYNRNKGWFLPTAIGALALLAGHDAGVNGDADKSLPGKMWDLWSRRLGALFGTVSDKNWNRLTNVDKKWLAKQQEKYREGKL